MVKVAKTAIIRKLFQNLKFSEPQLGKETYTKNFKKDITIHYIFYNIEVKIH